MQTLAWPPPIDPVEALLRAVRAERRALRDHPSDFPSIVGNRLASQGVLWPTIGGIFGSGERGRPLLRRMDVIPAAAEPAAILREAGVTACAAADGRIVAGTSEGRLLAWDRSQSEMVGISDEPAAPRASISLLQFIARNELLVSGDETGGCHLHLVADYRYQGSFAGHTTTIVSVAFDMTAQLFAAGARDGSIRLWQRSGFSQVVTLVGHTGAVTAMSFLPAETGLLSCSADGTLRLWETSSGRCLATLRGHFSEVTAALAIPLGQIPRQEAIFSAGRDGLLKFWSRAGHALATLGGHTGPINDMRLVSAPTGAPRIATCSDDGTVRLWTIHDPREERVLRGHSAPVLQVARCGNDGSLILSVDADGRGRLWQYSTGRCLREFASTPGGRSKLSVSSDGTLATCVAEDGSLTRIDLEQSAREEIAPTHVAIDASGTRMLVGSGGYLRFVNLRTGDDQTSSFQELPDSEAVAAARWTGSTFATLHSSGLLRTWTPDGTPGPELPRPQSPQIVAADFSPPWMALAGSDGIVTLTELELPDRVRQSMYAESHREITACACSPGGLVAIGSADGTLEVFDASRGASLLAVRAYEGPVLDCDLSSNGTVLLAAGPDGTLVVWDEKGVERWRIRAHADVITGCRIGTSGNRALTCSRDRTLKLWDLENGRCLETYYADAPLVSLSVARNQPLAAVADASGRVTIVRILEGFGTEPQAAA